jgi:hypothetical protein
MRRPLIWCIAITLLALPAHAENRYVGAKTCARCHNTPGQGNTFHQWQASGHAGAFAALQSHSESEPRECQGLKLWIVEIGRGVKYGLPRPAWESKECLPCHTTAFGAGPQLVASSFDPKDGVQCESCHGPGSAHVETAELKDGGEAPAELKHFEGERSIQAQCRTCHEGTCGDFDFATMWPKIAHSVPGAP